MIAKTKTPTQGGMIRSFLSHPALLIQSPRAWRHSSRVQSAVGLPGHASSEGPDDKGRSLFSSFRGKETGVADDHAGHAFLHDFCMTIPYSAIGLVASIALYFLGSSVLRISEALPLFGLCSIIVGLASAFSLSLWKKGQVGTGLTSIITMVSGGASSYIAYHSWICLKLKSVALSTPILCILWPLLILSSSLSLFAFYNVIAGGNPPRKK